MSSRAATRGPVPNVEPEFQGLERSVTFSPRPRAALLTASAPAAPPAPGADWTSVELHDLEAALLPALNAERAKNGGLPSLVTNAHVQASISFYCLEMAQYLFMAHDSPDTGDPRWPAMPWSTRIYLFGATGALGENLAYGFTDVAGVVAAWMSDIGHRDNILGSWVGVGCGVARDPKTGLIFWGTDFTSEGSSPPPPPPPPPPVVHPIEVPSRWRNKTTGKIVTVTKVAPVPPAVPLRVTYHGPARAARLVTKDVAVFRALFEGPLA